MSYQTRESRSVAALLAAWQITSACATTGPPQLGDRLHRRLEVRAAADRRTGSRARPPSRSACRSRRAEGSSWRAVPATCAAGCRGESRAGSCPCRSSGDSRACRVVPAAAACTARAADGVEIVGVNANSNKPSRSLTLSAPKTRIGARTPARRRTIALLDVRAGQHRAPACSSAQRNALGPVSVRVGFDDGNDSGRAGGAPLSARSLRPEIVESL